MKEKFVCCSEHEFFISLRNVCQKPLVSYLHLSFIVSKAFEAQISYIMFTTLICRGRAMIHTNVSKKNVPWIGRVGSTHINEVATYLVWLPDGVVDITPD